MLHPDDESKAFFKPVADVKYVVGMNLPRVIMDSSEKFIDLALMYNKTISCADPVHCLDILVDEKGVKYAKLSFSGIKYALSNGLSVIPSKESMKNKRVISIPDADIFYRKDKSIEERLDAEKNNVKIPDDYSVYDESGQLEFICPTSNGNINHIICKDSGLILKKPCETCKSDVMFKNHPYNFFFS